jgi:hypothetical protein
MLRPAEHLAIVGLAVGFLSVYLVVISILRRRRAPDVAVGTS